VRVQQRAQQVIAALIFAASLFVADQSCPWLDTATAAGVLGGQVTATVTSTACQFVRGRSKLRIEVRKSNSLPDRCGTAAEPLEAIGNEAFLCAKHHEVVGRVRDAVFTIRLNAPDWQSKAQQVAQEVAGALF
jgi:hypothetical protein